MRVLIDTTYSARAPYSGTGVYLARLTEALARLDGIEVITACNQRRPPPAGGGLGSMRNLFVDSLWTAVELPRIARRSGADVIHHPLPARVPTAAPAQVVTVHDVAFELLPQDFARSYRVYAHLTHRAAALKAGAVICVSETTAAGVHTLWGVPRERIVVARHGPGQEPRADPAAAARHFLYVGDDEPRKNLVTLITAYRRYRAAASPPLELVLAGSATSSEPGVRAEHLPSPARLAELYAGAAALVHPSRYEGFGLTALEAMSAGTPVLVADAPGLTEICGDAARYADPGDPDSFAAAMSEIAQDPSLRHEMAVHGKRRAAQFSWSQAARAHLDAYSLAVHRE